MKLELLHDDYIKITPENIEESFELGRFCSSGMQHTVTKRKRNQYESDVIVEVSIREILKLPGKRD